MRRLTLILSDLYLPEEARRGDAPFRRRVDLPNLDWLLRFAERRPSTLVTGAAGCWSKRFRRLRDLPVAASQRARTHRWPRCSTATWLATPVRSRSAARSCAAAGSRAVASRSRQSAQRWCEEFSRVLWPAVPAARWRRTRVLPDRTARQRRADAWIRRDCSMPTSGRRCPGADAG